MKYRHVISVYAPLIALFFTFSSSIAQQKRKDIESSWQKVYQLELKGLNQSASEIVNDIYTKAKKQQNQPQLIKALLYQSKFSMILEEEAQLKVIKHFKEELKASDAPLSNLLENIVANLYWSHFKRNQWRYRERTSTSEKVEVDDFRTWDLNTMLEEIDNYYQRSLEHQEITQNTALEDYEVILQSQKDSRKLRPTLFDFLANNALEFYQSSERTRIGEKTTDLINSSIYFDIDQLLSLESKDSLSATYISIKIYNQLLGFHQSDTDNEAFIAVALDKLDYLYENTYLPNRGKIYVDALEKLLGKFKGDAGSARILYQLADHYYGVSNDPAYPKDSTNFPRQKALDLCQTAIKNYPKNFGSQQCDALKNKILKPQLDLTTESHIPVDQHSRALIRYTNIDNLHLQLFKVDDEFLKKWRATYQEAEVLKLLKTLIPFKSWQEKLPQIRDYLSHSTEIILPPTEQGHYIMLATENEKLDKTSYYAYSRIEVTNMALVRNFAGKTNNFYVFDRNTGQPIEGATIHLYGKSGNPKNFLDKTIMTNQFGLAETTLQNTNIYQFDVKVYYQKQTATFESIYARGGYSRNDDDEHTAEVFLFTDRSIYRPGQKVYFKGILVQQKGQETSIVPDKYVWIRMLDTNHEELDSLYLKTNEFGSFNGTFDIPSNVLTGNFTLEVEEGGDYESNFYDELDDILEGELSFSVEEYKRPKFEINFDKVLKGYVLNDSVTAKGTAASLAGSPISNAQVSYVVKRLPFTQYPYFGHFSNPAEITHGNTITDATGNFNISFLAAPNLSIPKESLPVFQYEVTVDITDINGETRSSSQTINVGYHTLKLRSNPLPVYDIHSDEGQISITANNLNGQPIPAFVNVNIHYLVPPHHIKRKRTWQAPDLPMLTKQKFLELFPNDYYTTIEESYLKKELVSSYELQTAISQNIPLSNIQDWKPGQYEVVLKAVDASGDTITSKNQFLLTDSRSKKPTNNQLFSIRKDQPEYKVGDSVKLTLVTAAQNLTVTLLIEKNHTIVDRKVLQLSDEVKDVSIPISNEDKEGFAIHYFLGKLNEFKSGIMLIQVNDRPSPLKITTTTFRDKVAPGIDESWGFKIEGAGKEGFVAEAVASMYDASLDQFKSHQWRFFPYRTNRYYSYNRFDSHFSFGTGRGSTRYLEQKYVYIPTQSFDQLNWFGFSLINQRYRNLQYLRSLLVTLREKAEKAKKVHSKIDNSLEKGKIVGTIKEYESDPVPGASIIIKGTSIGTISDLYGNFRLNAKKGDILQVSFIGLETVEVIVGDDNVYQVTMIESIDKLEEVIVTAQAVRRKANASVSSTTIEYDLELEESDDPFASISNASGSPGNASFIKIRGTGSINGVADVLYVVDGIPVTNQEAISPDEIASISTLKDDAATAIYGNRGKNGVILITTKAGQARINQELANVKIRKNLQETAFFLSDLKTDQKGNLLINFTTPEALTRWNFQLLAHNKALDYGQLNLSTVTQKDLMVIPNLPRFLRQGDEVALSVKLVNLTDQEMNGFTGLQLLDPYTNQSLDTLFNHLVQSQPFQLAPKASKAIVWKLTVPQDINLVTCKAIAKAGNFADGEQSVLPILSNRTLVMETLPMLVKSKETKTFHLEKLEKNRSKTLKNHQLTLEVTSNPTWYAIQALPYLMEFPFECAEQTFARLFSNSLGNHIVESNEKIAGVFKEWQNSETLVSNLEKNEALKSILIQETPWLRDAQEEGEQKKRLALLFDLVKLQQEQESNLSKLSALQLSNGGFPWFAGSDRASRYITQHIVGGIGHLRKIGVDFIKNDEVSKISDAALSYLDGEILKDYWEIMRQASGLKTVGKSPRRRSKAKAAFLNQRHIHPIQVHYLYVNSFQDRKPDRELKEAIDFFLQQAKQYRLEFDLYSQAMIALVMERSGKKEEAQTIIQSFVENSITNPTQGMYWKSNQGGWRWYQSVIETQALLIEAFSEIGLAEKSNEENQEMIDNLKLWLLRNKQTNRWSNTKATTEAIYALLLKGNNWLDQKQSLGIKVGNQEIDDSYIKDKPEAGTGYLKINWKSEKIKPEMGKVTLTKTDEGIAWGALYWQYFEDLDQITASTSSLQVEKKLFLTENTAKGKQLTELKNDSEIKIGDFITVRIVIRTDRDMDFVHLKDMRASGLEPVNVLSEYKWQDGLGYYESTKDASTNFFFDQLRKGVYVFEYRFVANNAGRFSNGITSIQSMYAPEFGSHSEGSTIVIQSN